MMYLLDDIVRSGGEGGVTNLDGQDGSGFKAHMGRAQGGRTVAIRMLRLLLHIWQLCSTQATVFAAQERRSRVDRASCASCLQGHM